LKLSPDSFLFSDDFSGTVYLVRRKGSKPEMPEVADSEAARPTRPQTVPEPANAESKACFAAALIFMAAMFHRRIL
jgi:hypothetical protein